MRISDWSSDVCSSDLGAQRAHELVHKLLGREIDDAPLRRLLLDVQADGVHEVRLAEPDTAVEEKRIERRRRRVSNAPRCSVGQFVRLTDNEVVEGEARIERRGDAGAGTLRRILPQIGRAACRESVCQVGGNPGGAESEKKKK